MMVSIQQTLFRRAWRHVNKLTLQYNCINFLLG